METRVMTADDLEREQIEEARAMSPGMKLFLGPQIFDRNVQFIAAGVRSQFPDADEARVQEIVRERLALARRLENEE